MNAPKVIIIAGPNGAGKTTFAQEFLPQEAGCPVFVNADLIAAGLSPFAPEQAALQAGRLALESIRQHVARRESFAFETTLSGKTYSLRIPQWQRLGYRVELYFLRLTSAEMAVQRVAERVRQGGHSIPEATIRRRFSAGWRLFTEVYQPLVDQWVLYDNAGEVPLLVDWSPKHVSEPTPTYARPTTRSEADIQGSLAAIRRAAQRARQVAQQTGTQLVVMQGGQVVRQPPANAQPAP